MNDAERLLVCAEGTGLVDGGLFGPAPEAEPRVELAAVPGGGPRLRLRIRPAPAPGSAPGWCWRSPAPRR